MDQETLKALLVRLQSGQLSIPETLDALKNFPSEFVQDACLDNQRQLRTGIPEVIYGESKTAEQIIVIARAMLGRPGPLLITRVDSTKADQIRLELPELSYHPQARLLCGPNKSVAPVSVRGKIAIICAGTSDIGVAEEARITSEALGNPVATLYDAGVAGLHRLLARKDLLTSATAIIVVAGMEGALPSVVGGLVSCPVIGVPTSVGYGAGIGGFAALLGMLNSCSPGVSVVNIDNGFGAACVAAAINRND